MSMYAPAERLLYSANCQSPKGMTGSNGQLWPLTLERI